MATDPEKERFLKEFGQDYGYPNAPKNVDEIRATEFKRLNDVVYLDHAGATLYSESQMEDVFKDLNSTLYGNPHSQSNCSLTTGDIVGEARRQILSFFNASPGEYKCIFTSGATAALKLVGETFPWSSQSNFMYTMENHNSVLGIREYALNEGAAATAIDIEDVADLDGRRSGKSAIKIIPHTVQRRGEVGCRQKEQTSDTYNLFAFPSECNFSGLRFNLDLVNVIKEDSYQMPGTTPSHSSHWMVLIDAAKGSATSPPDLSKYKADFVVVSFYKLFGYPTGIGALIARNGPAKLLKKTYFSGGTVAASIADVDFYKRRDGIEEYFEDGTLAFVSIASLRHGFKILNTLTISAISRHTMSLALYVRNALLNLRHVNGSRVCTLYGVNDPELLCNKMGPTVSFNLKRPDGSWFGYREVEKLASLSNIQLRTGCFCNPGACAKHLGLSHSDLLSNIEAGHVCWDDRDILNGKPTGAVRVSFGYMSTFEDARKLLKFIKSSFVSLLPQPIHLDLFGATPFFAANGGVERVTTRYFLKSITVYPIKSCAGFTVESWPLCSTGLLHDREWLLKSLNGEILTQKKVPEMGFITTLVDLKLGRLIVESLRCKEKLQIELTSGQCIAEREVMEIYSQRYEVQGYGDEVDAWFSNAVGRPCTLVRSYAFQNHVCSNKNRGMGMCRDLEARLNFVNEAQFLLVSEESVADLNNRLRSKLHKGSNEQHTEVNPSRFRPNLVVSGGKPYAEDGWRSLKIGQTNFTSLGGCNRCQMINTTFTGGTVQRSNEPLATLASYRRLKGKIYFGILLKMYDSIDQEAWLRAGQEIVANAE
ncbi:Molybdenum cofactor sulfurase [Sesamum alatum]|uniref:Molybdenum cofactor sulfurase n=1 Tax=Sesamum alatum TaxID=300844 RepID=A0AAE2CYR7_9LAMI|nr:Molybdenum cofactor sulfurase [Sesamum alatum]